MEENEDQNELKLTNKQFTQSEKAKRGWWFSVFFMILVIALILFLSFVEIQEKNRDVLVGLIGMITGAVSSMLSIASGRDPSEVEELKDKLAKSEGDRQALIARLRDAQIQMQILREQIFELQKNYVHWTYGKTNMSAATSGSFLHKETKKYVNKDNQTLEGMFYTEANEHFTADAEEQREEESNRVKESIVKHILAVSNIDINTYEAYEWALIDLANDLKDVEPNMKLIAKDLREQKKPESDINKSIAMSLNIDMLRMIFNTSSVRYYLIIDLILRLLIAEI